MRAKPPKPGVARKPSSIELRGKCARGGYKLIDGATARGKSESVVVRDQNMGLLTFLLLDTNRALSRAEALFVVISTVDSDSGDLLIVFNVARYMVVII